MTVETMATLILIVFCLIFFVTVFTFFRTLFRETVKFRQRLVSPRLTVPVTVHAQTDRRVTFQAESGDLFTLTVPESEMRFLASGKCGLLTFRKRQFISFRQQGGSL